MKSSYLTLAAAVFLVSACQTGIDTSRKDIDGTTIHLTQWKPIQPHELIINIADLDGIEISDPQSRIRDNQVLHQRAIFDGAGILMTQHIQVNYFNQHGTDSINSREDAKAWVDKYYKGRNQKIVHGEARKISSGDRGGWLMSVDVQDLAQTCIMARVAFLGDTNKPVPIGERYDTTVQFLDCSAKRSMDDVEAFLNGMKLVKPEYNLIRFRMAGQ